MGCSRRTPITPPIDTGGPNVSTTWSAGSSADAIAGIDEGDAQCIGKMLVIWSAFARGGGTSHTSGSDGIRGHGHISGKDDRQIRFEFTTTDGKTGRIVLDGVAYELADGPLFLLRPEGDKLVVRQLKKDLSALELNAEGFKKFGRNDPEIMGFFSAKKAF
jgi:hypothetical protein